MALYVIDRSGPLSNFRRTATGGFIVDAALARIGTMVYVDKSGKQVKKFNPPDVLQASLDAITTSPVTNRHPSKMVTPETYQAVAAGHVVGKPEFDGKVITATLAIQDARLIADIESGKAREVSMGYMAEEEASVGTFDGETYDVARTRIEYNHIAIVPAGRAGSKIRLMLDSVDIPCEEQQMEMPENKTCDGCPGKKLKVGGKEYSSDKAQAAIDALELLLENAKTEAQDAKAQVEAKDAELVEAKSQAAFDAKFQERLAEIDAAKALEARRAAVSKAYPKMKDLDKKSAEVIDSLYETISPERQEVESLAPGAQGRQVEAAVVTDSDEKPVPARIAMLQRARQLRDTKVEDGE